ncbi:hypothetical protein [Kitasatospora sp. NPDC088134]|uniref:hypothetical protein n=1 Tax=Kitasatospora sp. NPDC088134 TaxID=3364071 RepID=UPI0037F29D2A
MTDDKRSARGGPAELPPGVGLPPVEALALAGRARAAAGRPVPLPRWYGPAVGLAFAAYGAAIGQSYQHRVLWLIPLCAFGLVLVLAPMVRAAVRVGGVARLVESGASAHVLRAAGLIVLAAALGGLVAWFATGDQRWAITAAGAVGGAAHWGAVALFNRHLEEQSMSSSR